MFGTFRLCLGVSQPLTVSPSYSELLPVTGDRVPMTATLPQTTLIQMGSDITTPQRS